MLDADNNQFYCFSSQFKLTTILHCNLNHIVSFVGFQEVGKKSERITILEREKASLIRELLQTRNQNRNSQEEAVF